MIDWRGAGFDVVESRRDLKIAEMRRVLRDFAIKARDANPRIVWQQDNAQALPFSNQSIDVISCQFGFMFFPDRSLAYREAKRVLKNSGTFLFSVWDKSNKISLRLM